tara:strand:- start:211 stop:672 length:462 start_codon:yes stop_codon:yes gene_type:complete
MPGADTPRKRELIFWQNCLPLRALLLLGIIVAARENIRILQLGFVMFMGGWGIGFLRAFVEKLFEPSIERKFISSCSCSDKIYWKERLDSVRYGNFGGIVWWQWPRLFHGVFLTIYAIGTLFYWEYAYFFAIADFAVGFLSGIIYYIFLPCCM